MTPEQREKARAAGRRSYEKRKAKGPKLLTPEQREKRRAANARWRAANPEKHRLSQTRWQAANPQRYRETRREAQRRYNAGLTEEQRARKNQRNRESRERCGRADDSAYEARRNERRRAATEARRRAAAAAPTLRTTLSKNDLYSLADGAVAKTYPQHARDDMISEMVLAVLEGNIKLDELRANSKRFASRYWSSRPEYHLRSLDEPAFESRGRALHDTALVAAIEHVF